MDCPDHIRLAHPSPPGNSSPTPRTLTYALLAGTTLAATLTGCPCRAAREAAELAWIGDSRSIYERDDNAPRQSPHAHPDLLVVALDGVDRTLLYDMLRAGELPETAALLGGVDSALLVDDFISTLPSSTMDAWVTAFTGVGPATHGVTGNEFFIREKRELAAPNPTYFSDAGLVLQNYTDGYLHRFIEVPTVYERLRARDQHALIWVAMHPVFRGADKLLLTSRAAFVEAVRAFVEKTTAALTDDNESRAVYEQIDDEIVDELVKDLDDSKAVPDVIVVYLPGTDLYAHVAEQGPDEARRVFLREVVDPKLGELADALEARGALDDRYVVITSDHGHVEVVHDDAHAMGTGGGDPPDVLERAGFRPRPAEPEVGEDVVFDVAFAYQGAMAYVYLANRETCPPCDWTAPPRLEEDVMRAADALMDGLGDALDLVLIRQGDAAERETPLSVYLGQGLTQPLDEYLAANPREAYVQFPERLRDLTVGPHADRAGDIVLIARNGGEDDPARRYYFAAPYHSWHGSPARRDSEIPLIVARRGESRASLAARVRRAIGERPLQQKLTDLMLALRFGS